jgi:hypothetical protein
MRIQSMALFTENGTHAHTHTRLTAELGFELQPRQRAILKVGKVVRLRVVAGQLGLDNLVTLSIKLGGGQRQLDGLEVREERLQYLAPAIAAGGLSGTTEIDRQR